MFQLPKATRTNGGRGAKKTPARPMGVFCTFADPICIKTHEASSRRVLGFVYFIIPSNYLLIYLIV